MTTTRPTRIDEIFARLRDEGRAALMPFVVAGEPSLAATAALLPALEQAGASIVEIGFPFSDPIADGPVIAESMHRALERGVTPRAVLETVARARPDTALGLVAMVSASIVRRAGAPRFVETARAAGLDGLIVPDLDVADAAELAALADEHGLALALLVAPDSAPARVDAIVRHCRGFVYLLARRGLTGESEGAADVAGPIARVRAATDLPVAVGFGLATPAQVSEVVRHADAAIVGSALVRRLAADDDPVGAAAALVRELAAACRPRDGATA